MTQTVSRRTHTFKALSNSHSRTMISTQTMLCVCSPRIAQPETCIQSLVSLSPWRRRAGLKWCSGLQNGRGDSTSATKQVSPFSSSTEDASDDAVPAKQHTSVLPNFPGTKGVELMDPISPTKLASTLNDQLPPLLSMIIDGLPPLQQSKYVDEAEKRLHQYVERYPNISSLESYCRVGVSTGSYGYPGVINLDRLVAISFNYGLLFLLDDIFFDTPDQFLQDQYGISHGASESPQKIQEYLDHLDAVMSQEVQPSNPAPLIETLMWESGRDLLELSNPKWFKSYVACVVDHHRAGAASYVDILQGRNLYFQDLESYAAMRAANVGGNFLQVMMEFAHNTYISDILRVNPYFKNIMTATSIHIGFANDVFSYYKESSIEQNPHNLISVLMECEGKPFVQTVHMAIGLVNTYGHALMDLEAKAWNSTLRSYFQDIRVLIAGNIYFSFMDYRYRHPDLAFPEMRDMTRSWKVLPHAKGPGL